LIGLLPEKLQADFAGLIQQDKMSEGHEEIIKVAERYLLT